MKKRQVIIIRGGETFASYEDYLVFLKNYTPDLGRLASKSWRDSLGAQLGEDFQVISLAMPNSLNSKYFEWKIFFERFIQQINDGVILVGNSLGGTFLAKYLSENLFPKKIAVLFLVAAPYDVTDDRYSLGDFIVDKDISKISDQVKDINLYFCEDDPSVSFANLERYQNALPGSQVRIFKGIGHFKISALPEMAEDMKKFTERK